MSIRHGVGDGVSVMEGLSRRSTVADVLDDLTNKLDLESGKWIIIEVKYLH